MVVDYFHQRTTIVSAKACVNALDGLYCSKTAVKGPIPVLMPAAGGKIFAFVQTIPPPGGVGGSPDLSGQALFHTFLSGQKPYVPGHPFCLTKLMEVPTRGLGDVLLPNYVI